MTNAQKWNEYIKKYQKENCTRYTLILNNINDKDIKIFFDNNPDESRSGLIKKALRLLIQQQQ